LELVSRVLVRVPVIGATQEVIRRILLGFLFRKKMRVGITLVVMGSGAGGIRFRIERGFDGMCFTGMPLAPA